MNTTGKEYTTDQISEIIIFCKHLIKELRFEDLECFLELMLILDMPILVKVALLRSTLAHNKFIKDAWNNVFVSVVGDCDRERLHASTILKGLKYVTDD